MDTLTKIALNRLSKNVAQGVYNPRQLREFVQRGFLRSPEQYAQGMHTGNVNISNKLGLGPEFEAALKDKSRMLMSATPRQGDLAQMISSKYTPANIAAWNRQDSYIPSALLGALEGLAGRITDSVSDSTLNKLGVPSSMIPAMRTGSILRQHPATKTVRAPYGYTSAVAVPKGQAVRTIAGHTFPKTQTRLQTSEWEQLRALANRHEMDELRLARRPMTPATRGFINLGFGHAHPGVISNEMRNSQFLNEVVREPLGSLRRKHELKPPLGVSADRWYGPLPQNMQPLLAKPEPPPPLPGMGTAPGQKKMRGYVPPLTLEDKKTNLVYPSDPGLAKLKETAGIRLYEQKNFPRGSAAKAEFLGKLSPHTRAYSG